jgi:hypothetical protein
VTICLYLFDLSLDSVMIGMEHKLCSSAPTAQWAYIHLVMFLGSPMNISYVSRS